jgi:hypothetical protein
MNALLAATEYVDVLKGTEYKLLTVLGKLFDREGVAELALSYGQLAKAIGGALSGTIAAVAALAARELIECDKMPGNGVNRYRAPLLTGHAVPSPKIGEGTASAASPKIGSPNFGSPKIGEGTSLEVIEKKAKLNAKPKSRAPVPYLPTYQTDYKEEEVGRCENPGPMAAILETLKTLFHLPVTPANPKLQELLALAQKLEVPLERMPDYLCDLRTSRPRYSFRIGGILCAAQEGNDSLEAWKLRRQRKPQGRAASHFERPLLEETAPEPPDRPEQMIEWLEEFLSEKPDDLHAPVFRARLAELRAMAPPSPRAMAAGAGA